MRKGTEEEKNLQVQSMFGENSSAALWAPVQGILWGENSQVQFLALRLSGDLTERVIRVPVFSTVK